MNRTLGRRLEKLEQAAAAGTRTGSMMVLMRDGEAQHDALLRTLKEKGMTLDPAGALVLYIQS